MIKSRVSFEHVKSDGSISILHVVPISNLQPYRTTPKHRCTNGSVGVNREEENLPLINFCTVAFGKVSSSSVGFGAASRSDMVVGRSVVMAMAMAIKTATQDQFLSK